MCTHHKFTASLHNRVALGLGGSDSLAIYGTAHKLVLTDRLTDTDIGLRVIVTRGRVHLSGVPELRFLRHPVS